MNGIAAVLLLLVLLLLSGMFAMAETALLALRPSRVAQLAEEGRRGAATAQRLMQNPTRYLATCQAGTTLLGFGVAAAATALLAPGIARWLTSQLAMPVLTAYVVSVTATTLLSAGAAMALAGLAPKAAALRAPDVWAPRLAPTIEVCGFLFAPFSGLSLAISRLVVPGAKFETPMVTREEFEKIAQTSGRSGEIDDEEAKIITNVIDLSETLVRAVMTPRTDLTAVPEDAPVSEVLDAIIGSGHSRIPVFRDTVDNIVGVVHAKDLLSLFYSEKSRIELKHVLRPPYFVNETVKVSDLLQQMRRHSRYLAIVQDEYAGTEGLVTIEDLLEEIVGEIRDEYDRDEPDITVISPSESLVDGRMSLDDVNDRLGTALAHEDYDTLGGLVFGLLGHEPEVGERVEQDGVVFVVDAIEGRRIKQVRVIRPTGSGTPEGAREH